MSVQKRRLNQYGDTIVEVLIALVVIGMAISLAYGTASRSLRANRQAQERSEALKRAEGQVERLKNMAADPTKSAALFAKTTPFCLADEGGVVNKLIDEGAIPALASDPLSVPPYATACISDNLYHLSITPNSGTANQFSIRARWASLSNGGNEEVLINYRLYPEN